MQNHTTNRTSFARPAAAGLAALALGLGSVAGLGALPANAQDPAPSAQVAGQDTTANSENRTAWLEQHGTAPLGYTSGRGTGPTWSPVIQQGLGATSFQLRVPDPENHLPVAAPDGTYQVDVGDGSTGQKDFVEVRDGVANLGENATLKAAKGSEMVQFQGPLLKGASGENPDEPRFLGSDGKPSTLPQIHAGSIYSAETAMAALPDEESMNNSGPHGVYTENEGNDAITFNPESTYVIPEGDHPEVNVTYKDAATQKPVTVPTEATFGKNQAGELQLQGGVLPQLPSGRYTLSFTDREGTEMNFYMMVGDPNRTPEAGDSAMYDLPY